MNTRGEIFSLITDIRGRLDELEQFIRALPGSPVPTPASFDEGGVEDITPESFRQFRREGLAEAVEIAVFERKLPFVQIGAPAPVPVTAESFELSDLHKSNPEPAFGLQIVPDGPAQKWFTFELICPITDLGNYEWTEWVLKLSVREPMDLTVFVYITGDNLTEKIELARIHVTEFASFQHIRLSGAEVRRVLKGRSPQEMRLILGTGGAIVPLRIYGLNVFGKQ